MIKNDFKKSKILAILFSAFLIIYFAIIPKIINTEKYQSQIKKNIETSSKSPIKLGKMHSFLTWNLKLKINLDELSIYHKDSSAFIRSGPLSFEISLADLFMHKVKIQKIYIENLTLPLKRLKNGHFNIEELFSDKIHVIFYHPKITVSNYKIFFIDEFSAPPKSFFIKGKNLKISDFNPKKAIKIELDGQILSTNRPNTDFNFYYSSNLPLNRKNIFKNNLYFKGKIKNLYPDMYLHYIQRYFPDYSSLSGVINSNFDINLHKHDFWSDTFKFNIKSKDFIAKKQFKGEVLKALGLLELDIFAIRKKQKITLEKLTIKSPDIDIKLNGEINRVDSKNPELNLKLFIKNSKVESISYLFPEEIKVPNNIFAYFKKFKVKANFSGNVKIESFINNLDLFGNLKFTGFSATRNSTTIPDGKILVYLKKKTCKLDADILTSTDNHIYIKGTIIPHLNKISLGVKSSLTELRLAQELLFAIRDIMKFNLGHFVENSILEGKGNSSLYIKGDSKNHYLYGYIKLLDCKLNYLGLSQPFEHVIGKVIFYKDNIYFQNIKAVAIKSNIVINGKVIKNKVDLILDSKKFNATEARKLINESKDLVVTKKTIKNMKALSGYFIGKLIFSNDLNHNFIFKEFKLQILEGSVLYKEVGFPIKLLKGSILITDKVTVFKEVQSEIFGIPSEISGQIKVYKKGLVQNYTVNFKKLPAEKIHEFEVSPLISKQVKDIFQKFQNTKGYIDADLNFFSKGVFADLKFYDTDFLYKPLNLPVTFKNGRLFITPEIIQFEAINANIANSPVYINGIINNYQKVPVGENLNLNIPQNTDINLLTHLFPKNKLVFDSGSFSGNLNFQGPISFSRGNFELSDIIYKNIFIKHALLDLDSDFINLKDSDVEIAGQKLKISATADKNFNSPLKINQLKISAHKFDIENFMQSFKKNSNNSKEMNFPVVIQDGLICFDELIFKNFCATNFSSSLCLDENTVLNLPDLQFQAANTCAKGCISYNLKNTALKGNLSVQNIYLSSMTNLFKLAPNDLSGNLGFDIGFCTYGKSQYQIINNTNARADFRIENGYLKKLGKAQYLLLAQSTFLNGISKISLNKILSLFFPKNLGLFKNFSGTIIAQNSCLSSNNLSLESENLNIRASSNLNIKTKKYDIIALGQLPEENKRLGSLGDISISSLFACIPGVGVLSGNIKLLGLIGIFPWINNMSEEEATQKYKRFLVRVLKINPCKEFLGSLEWLEKLSENEKNNFCF